MAYEPHFLLTWGGTFTGTPEIWQCSLALKQNDYNSGIGLNLDPNATVWNDVALDVANYHYGNARIAATAVARWAKIASIGTDGKYTGEPALRELGTGGAGVPGGGTTGYQFPLQTAWAVTLRTDTLLSRVKGRFYSPAPKVTLGADGRASVADVEYMRTSVDTLITNINNQPGIDVLDLVVAVASGTRKDGLGGQNHPVTSVTVGRQLDTIRRRRNKQLESYPTPEPVA